MVINKKFKNMHKYVLLSASLLLLGSSIPVRAGNVQSSGTTQSTETKENKETENNSGNKNTSVETKKETEKSLAIVATRVETEESSDDVQDDTTVDIQDLEKEYKEHSDLESDSDNQATILEESIDETSDEEIFDNSLNQSQDYDLFSSEEEETEEEVQEDKISEEADPTWVDQPFGRRLLHNPIRTVKEVIGLKEQERTTSTKIKDYTNKYTQGITTHLNDLSREGIENKNLINDMLQGKDNRSQLKESFTALHNDILKVYKEISAAEKVCLRACDGLAKRRKYEEKLADLEGLKKSKTISEDEFQKRKRKLDEEVAAKLAVIHDLERKVRDGDSASAKELEEESKDLGRIVISSSRKHIAESKEQRKIEEARNRIISYLGGVVQGFSDHEITEQDMSEYGSGTENEESALNSNTLEEA